MRFRRVRFSVAWMMVVVAFSAIVASVPALRRQSKQYGTMARWHRMVMDQASVTGAERGGGPLDERELARLNSLFKSYYLSMIACYETASCYPWLSVSSGRVNPETGGLEQGFSWFNLHCRLGSPGMQDLSWGEPKCGGCPAQHRIH